MKTLQIFFATLICMAIALIPEIAMWFIYDFIKPESDLTRILTLIAFWFGGAGLCVGFAALAALLWLSIIESASRPSKGRYW